MKILKLSWEEKQIKKIKVWIEEGKKNDLKIVFDKIREREQLKYKYRITVTAIENAVIRLIVETTNLNYLVSIFERCNWLTKKED